MDFDEYEYLEKAVENSQPTNGSAPGKGSEEKERRRRSSAAGDEEREKNRERGRVSKRSRSAERDAPGDRHRDRDRDRENGRESHRGSSRRREHREQDEDKSRDREKESGKHRETDREKDRDKEGKRARIQTERHREEGRERIRERSKDREHKLREHDRDHDVRRKKDGVEPEADPERDQRTVFAYQLSLKADERDVYEFFSKAGKVRDVRLIMDRNTRRSKGVGYIEFYDVMSVPMAIALSGQLLLGLPVMVKPSEAEKNLVQSNAASGGAASAGARKLYVGNLHSNITEDQLRQVFESFGQVELVQLPMDPLSGLCKGFGFIQFARLEDAKAAQSLNGQLDIAGRTIKVSAVTEQGGVQVGAANAGDLDDDDGGGLALNASSRALLMQKLDRSGTASSLTTGIGVPATSTPVPIPNSSVLGSTPVVSAFVQQGVPALGASTGLLSVANPLQSFDVVGPTECLLLKNMFDPSAETEPDFDLDIKEDVRDECSKFGTVKHIFVDKFSAGFVYLQFDEVSSAVEAQRALHGRWFAGKMITATFMLPKQYEAKFPGKS